MFNILEKLLVFILEGAKATPEEGVEELPPSANRKPMIVLLVTVVLSAAAAYGWYENYVKSAQEIAKLKEANLQKNISDLQRANFTLKEERIKLTATVQNINKELTEKTRLLQKLTHDFSVLEAELSDEKELSIRQKTAMASLHHQIEKLNGQLSNYAKDTQIIWDKMVTLGQEEGT